MISKNSLQDTAQKTLSPERRRAKRLERLRTTLWQQWCQMDTAWRNHNQTDGNLDSETLAGLGRIVEATRVAVDDVLQISGRALEVKREAEFPASTTSPHEEPLTILQQGRPSQDAGGGATHAVEVAEVAATTGANDDGKEAVTDEICGEAALITKRVTVDITDDNTDPLIEEVKPWPAKRRSLENRLRSRQSGDTPLRILKYSMGWNNLVPYQSRGETVRDSTGWNNQR